MNIFMLIIRSLLCLSHMVKAFFQSIFNRRKIFILNTPVHGNLGDQAILFAEEKVISEVLPKYEIIKIEHVICRRIPKIVKVMVGKSPVCLHGGGYLGDLWKDEDRAIKYLIQYLKDNNILFFPQTLCSENPERYSEDFAKLLNDRDNFYIFLRDKKSYDIFKQYIAKNIFYSPDIVLYLERENHVKYHDVVISLRRDKEKTMTRGINNQILDSVKNNNIVYKDTVEDKSIIYSYNRKKKLNQFFDIYKNAKLVITDRLHGMIFAYLTNTPCLVFSSKSPKVEGVYQWIKNADYIKLHEGADIKKEIHLMINGDYSFGKVIGRSDFKDIENAIRKIINE